MGDVFPTIIGKNLNKETISIPNDFTQRNIIVIMAFQRWHQSTVDEMIRLLELNNLQHYYDIIEVPVVQKMSWFRQRRLDAIMRAGITDFEVRQRTVTVYTDKPALLKSLSITSDQKICWYVVESTTSKVLFKGVELISQSDLKRMNSL
tara:strand:+ start:3223 stop:3669 length:447 start_codon:yes stop_codon:yes gene_type:complete